MKLFGVHSAEVTSNARAKIYPAATVLQVSNHPIFQKAGWEARHRPYQVPSKGNAAHPERSLESSLLRARSAIRDICLCNRFTHFITLTLSPEKIDRYDIKEIVRQLAHWLKNMGARKGLLYIIIPEYHKDGAIHLHGLCRLGSMQTIRAKSPHTGKLLSTKQGQPIYNLPDWKLGYSTCIPLDENYEKACNYICKYLSKDSHKIFGKWYWSSRALVKKPEIAVIDGGIDFDLFCNENPQHPIFSLYGDVRLINVRY